ncbi:MAG: DUF255 domain-containing protein [Elusimicrobiota bacterium]|nr:DUF255 domain-containing protein [Elusimicrobiota bacterium]
MKEDLRTDEQKARSKRAHANSMIVMGAVTTACALAAGLIAMTGGDMPDFMYGRFGRGSGEERPAVRVPKPSLVAFEPWGDAAFARARREDKLVLLHLTSVWSRHGRWMEETVYGDPACAQLVTSALVPVKADLEERPELLPYHRGWPTTALLLPDRRLVVAGTAMSCPMFKAFVEVVLARGRDAAAAAAETEGRRPAGAPRPAGPNAPYFPPWRALTREELPRALKLEDPVWGGFYRYSSAPDGSAPEHERLLGDQADAVTALSVLDPEAAKRTLAFVEKFLALPAGGYAASLDSEVFLADGRVMDGRAYFALDDARRRAYGLPRADRRRFKALEKRMADAVLASPVATPAQKAHARLR